MRILIVTPARPGSRQGNRVSAERWRKLLRGQGHRVRLVAAYTGQPCDVLVALHAVAGARSIAALRRARPEVPVVLVLTGTDLYRDLLRARTRATVLRSLAFADLIVTLNREAVRDVPPRFRPQVRCIVQSAAAALAPRLRPSRPPRTRSAGGPRAAFTVCVVGHLRKVKDPLRAAYAARRLPAGSRVRVEHAGRALSGAWARRALAEMERNPRYVWRGELGAAAVRRLMARADVLVHASRMEGGANAVGEAVRAGLPVLASRIPGNVGLLGAGYGGYFPPGDAAALARLLRLAETEPATLRRLRHAVRRLAGQFDPAVETRAWGKLLAELGRPGR